ncbi:MAG: Tic22 family protein [Xenococcaceae cyanobacterium]
MKSLVRWSATLGLVGSAVLGSWFGGNLEALALPQEQVMQKLSSIPVFVIADDKGDTIIAQGENNKQIAMVFISQQDAQNFILQRLQTENPELASQVKVMPVSLGEVYQVARANENQTNSPDFNLVPMQQQVQSAMTLLRQQDQQVEEFQGVPIFFATVKRGDKEAYLTYRDGDQIRIPLFFEKEALQQIVEQFKEQQPNIAPMVKIKVTPLEVVIAAFQNDNDEALSNMVLIPSEESIEFVRSFQPSSNNN